MIPALEYWVASQPKKKKKKEQIMQNSRELKLLQYMYQLSVKTKIAVVETAQEREYLCKFL